VLLAAWAFFAGMGLIFGAPEPRSLEQAMPSVIVVAWAVSQFLGGAMLIVGGYFPLPFTGMLIEGAGQTALAAQSLVYASALIRVNGWETAWLSALLVFAFGMASGWRVKQIYCDLRRRWALIRHRESK
jgi:hypothetical protein